MNGTFAAEADVSMLFVEADLFLIFFVNLLWFMWWTNLAIDQVLNPV